MSYQISAEGGDEEEEEGEEEEDGEDYEYEEGEDEGMVDVDILRFDMIIHIIWSHGFVVVDELQRFSSEITQNFGRNRQPKAFRESSLWVLRPKMRVLVKNASVGAKSTTAIKPR